MPAFYEFECNTCPRVHEVRGTAAKERLQADPACRCGGELRRVWHAKPVHFNAPGFTKARDIPSNEKRQKVRKGTRSRR